MKFDPFKAWLKTQGPFIGCMALIIVGVAVFVFALLCLVQWSANKQNAATVAAAPVKAAEAGQALAQDAVKTLDAAGRRDRLTITVHQENARALAEAPGAAAPVDPELVGVLRRGLCRYAAYANDPGCVEVRGRDPAVVP